MTIKSKCNINVKQYFVYLNAKKAKKAGKIIMYKYKNMS